MCLKMGMGIGLCPKNLFIYGLIFSNDVYLIINRFMWNKMGLKKNIEFLSLPMQKARNVALLASVSFLSSNIIKFRGYVCLNLVCVSDIYPTPILIIFVGHGS